MRAAALSYIVNVFRRRFWMLGCVSKVSWRDNGKGKQGRNDVAPHLAIILLNNECAPPAHNVGDPSADAVLCDCVLVWLHNLWVTAD